MTAQTTLLLRRKQPQPTITLPHLPFDLVVEILCILPVKHLVQLRCVCKSWNSLISGDSKFANKHLRLSTSSHDRHHLILSSPGFLLLHSPISSMFTSTSTITAVKQFSNSITEILNKRIYANRASTCDSMLCFNIDNSSVLLCNPTIGKFTILPPLNYPDQLFTMYTLVYDRFTNRYKIIAINHLSSIIQVSVYTLGTDYWRRIQDFPGPNLIPRSKSGIFLNDSVNWLVFASPFIVSLDLEKETYQKLSLPDFDVQYTTCIITTLGTLRGCLSILFGKRDNFSDIWIMKEYDNDKSWIKLLTVPQHDFGLYIKALYISKDDQMLMECVYMGKNSLVVYDSINNTFKTPKFQNNIHGKMVANGVYVESLIFPF